MSARYSIVPAAAALDLTLSASELRVLIVLGTFLDRDNKAFPSQTTLAEASGITRETTNRALKKLADLGYITSTQQTRNKAQTVNLYRVIMDPDLHRKTSQDPVTTESQGCDAQITGGVTSRDHTEQPHINTNKKNNKKDLEIQEKEENPDAEKLAKKIIGYLPPARKSYGNLEKVKEACLIALEDEPDWKKIAFGFKVIYRHTSTNTEDNGKRSPYPIQVLKTELWKDYATHYQPNLIKG